MDLGLDISLRQGPRPALPGPPQSSDPSVTAVDAEGWRASYVNPITFDPVGDPKFLVVERPGHDAAGDPATVIDPLVLMARIREPYPNEATLTPQDVALSDVVYAGDTILPGGPPVTNNSTRAYPKPQALWLNHDLDVASSATYTARLAVAHAHARNGRPVAAVRFTATDGTNTVETVVTSMSVTSYAASGLSVPHFAGVLDFSTLTPGVLITIDAKIRPWVGPAFTVSTDADVYPSVNLTVLKVLNDPDGSYGTAYAYLDPVAGNDSTGAVSATAATAQAAPYATIGAAVLGINGFNSANHGRTGVSGGVIRLEPGVHTHESFGAYAVTEVPLIIEAANPAQKAATIYQDAGVTQSNGLPDKVKFQDLTLRRNATGSVIFLDNAAVTGSENMLVTERCTWDDNSLGAPWNAWVYRPGRFWNIDCDGVDVGQCKQFSTNFKACISIGSGAGSLQSFTYHAVGCRDLDAFMFDNSVTADVQTPRGDFYGWNHLGQGTDSERCLNVIRAVDDRGIAIIGNVFEQFGGTTGPAYSIGADGITEPADNVTIMCNTVVGSRTNLLYQDAGSVKIAKYGRCAFNVDYSWNSKDDTFPPADGNRTGNWAFQYRVGFRSNAALEGSNNGSAFGYGNFWLGEIAALGDVTGSAAVALNPDWANDQSFMTGGTGSGDYTPGPGSELPPVPAGLAPYAFDQKGRAVPDDGTATIGAIQP